LEENYIKVENKFIAIDGDSSTVNYQFSLDKPFCSSEIILFIKHFLKNVFLEKFVKEINENWSKDTSQLEAQINSFYKDIKKEMQLHPEEYGIDEDQMQKFFEEEEQEEEEELFTVKDMKKFKEQLNQNPKFLENVFDGYMKDILQD